MIKNYNIFLLVLFINLGISSYAQVVKEKPEPPENKGTIPTLPQTGMVWVDGFWRWDLEKNEYVWCMGHYVKPIKDHFWENGKWKKMRNGYKWIPGKWKKLKRQSNPSKIL